MGEIRERVVVGVDEGVEGVEDEFVGGLVKG